MLCWEETSSFAGAYFPIDASGSHAWLWGDNMKTLVNMDDDGAVTKRDLSPIHFGRVEFDISAAQADGLLMQIWLKETGPDDSQLLAIQHGNTTIEIADSKQNYLLNRNHGGRRIWLSNDNPAGLTTATSFTAAHLIPTPGSETYDRDHILACDNVCYIPVEDANGVHIYRADADKSTFKKLKSWDEQVLPHYKREWQMPSGGGMITAFRLPDHRIAFQFPDDSRITYHVQTFLYDQSLDRWQQGSSDNWYTPLYRGDKLYGLSDRGVVAEWRGDRWQPLGRIDVPDVNIFSMATDSYFYADTSFGLYRVRWEELLSHLMPVPVKPGA